MSWNINSSYGKLLAERVGLGGAGKMFVVGASGVAHRDVYQELFSPDNDGVVRFAATIDAAIGLCTANAGDVIVVLPGHTETVANATTIVADVAGISIIGLGQGTNRPTITLATSTAASIPVTAENVRFSNLNFRSNLANIVTLFYLSADGFTLENCNITASSISSTSLGFLAIITTSTTDAGCDFMTVRNNQWYDLVASVNSCFIKQNATSYSWTIANNVIRLGVQNNYPSLILQATGKVNQQGVISGNRVMRLNSDTATGAILITTDSSSNRSILCDNYVQHSDTAAELLISASSGYGVFNNYASGVAGASGYLLPAADA